ncbi:unnamed protein product [Effrenium voratum]|uniref:Uncharacterized protein n=1 Tax=Effrenium voratum TaxID=2562239 RepID=A0AA36IM74_9DINO|nr:unnamed protein product [Effrenium voratum]
MDRLSKRAVPDDAASTHSADGRTPLSPWPGSSQAKVPPLPGRGSLPCRLFGAAQWHRPARELPDTPQDSRKSQVPRYSIGSPLDTAKPEAASPWWKQVAEMEPKAAEREDESPVKAADPPAEVLQPLLAALREDFKRELQEAQLAMMEQNFRLHAELRKDVDALRREVQQLRGELRVL